MYHYDELFYQITLHVMYFTNNQTCITICRENAQYSLHVLFCHTLAKLILTNRNTQNTCLLPCSLKNCNTPNLLTYALQIVTSNNMA